MSPTIEIENVPCIQGKSLANPHLNITGELEEVVSMIQGLIKWQKKNATKQETKITDLQSLNPPTTILASTTGEKGINRSI